MKPLAPGMSSIYSAPPPDIYGGGGCYHGAAAPTRPPPSRKPLAPAAFPTYAAPPPYTNCDGGCCHAAAAPTRERWISEPQAPMVDPTYTTPPPHACVLHPPPRAFADAMEAPAAALAGRGWFPTDDAVWETPTRGRALRALPPPPLRAPSVTAAVPPPPLPPPRAAARPPPPSGCGSETCTCGDETPSARRAARQRPDALPPAAAAWTFAKLSMNLPSPGAARATGAARRAVDHGSVHGPPRAVAGRADAPSVGATARPPPRSAPSPPWPAAVAEDDPRASWEDVIRRTTAAPVPSTPPTAGAAAAASPAAAETGRQDARHGRYAHGQHGGRGYGGGGRSWTAAAADAAAAAATPRAPAVDLPPPLLRRLRSPALGGGGSTSAVVATDEVGQTMVARGDVEGGDWRAVVWERYPLGTGGIATIAWRPS